MKRLLLSLALVAFAGSALAQVAGDVTFGASVTNANGTLNTTLTWSTTPAATSCTASGHSSWTGTKAASGSLALPAIALSGTYNLTLTCNWPGNTSAIVSWTRPTTNTDGSALALCPVPVPSSGACLAGYRVFKDETADIASPEAQLVNTPSALTHTWTNISPAGTYYFAVEVFNANGVPSVLSNVASKVITATASKAASVTLTVNPKPSPPTAVTVN
jgi:hypothetical protein